MRAHKPAGCADMTLRENFRLLMAERRLYMRGTPEHDWRTRAARKFIWIMRDVPTTEWPK